MIARLRRWLRRKERAEIGADFNRRLKSGQATVAALSRRVKALEARVTAIEKAKGKLLQKPIEAPPDRARGEEQTGEAQGSARAGSAAPAKARAVVDPDNV